MKAIKSSKILKLTMIFSLFMLSLFGSVVFAKDSKETTKETNKMYFSLSGENQFININSSTDVNIMEVNNRYITNGTREYTGTYSKDGVKIDIEAIQAMNNSKNSNNYDFQYDFVLALEKITDSENTKISLEANGVYRSDNYKQIPFSINDILNKNDKIELSMFQNQVAFSKKYDKSISDNYKLTVTEVGTTEFINPIYSKNGSTLLPLRYLCEMLGNDVFFNSKTNVITINDPLTKKSVILTIDSTSASINGISNTLNVAPERVEGRTYIPLRFVSEAFDAKVGYDEKSGKISIKKGY